MPIDGRAYYWGQNAFGQLGDGTVTDQSIPTLAPGAPSLVSQSVFERLTLFSQRTHLNDIWNRRTGTTEEFWTRDAVPGRRFGGEKPVYVLTSAYTFSGAEEFSYNLKALKRATIVGEVTGGGAHPVGPRPVGNNDSSRRMSRGSEQGAGWMW